MNSHPEMTQFDRDRHFGAQRVTPSNMEAEQALLGAILINNAAYDRVAPFLEVQHFHEPLHGMIFAAAAKLIEANKVADPITVKGFLPETARGLKIDGEDATIIQYLARLIRDAGPVVVARSYGEAIQDAWIRRQAIAACEDVATIAYDLDPDKDVLTEIAPIEDRLAKLRAERVKLHGRVGAGKHYLDNMTAAHQRGEIRGVPICLPEIGDVISEPCLEAGNLYGLLSSSGEGKTSLTLQMIHYALKRGHPTLFLSFDQSSDQCVRQMVAQEHGIEARRQRNPKLLSEKEWGTCVDFGSWIDLQPFEVIKCTDQSAPQLVGFARTFLKRYGNGKAPFIVVDHIGSVKPEDRRADEGTKAKDINKIFKAGAEMTDAAWLVLNQRNSYGMKRDNPRPISADLFGGDPAKQAYDAILYVYRFKKFLEERKATASTGADWKKINTIFPSAVREEGIDIAELGAIKVRFGSPHVTERVIFEDRFTRYKSQRQEEQEGFL